MIIGITGTYGAGKGTVAAYLTKEKNFVYLSVRNFLAAEVLRQGKMVNRETIAKVASELKAAHGADYIVKELFSQTLHEKHYIVMESIRTLIEEGYLQSHGVKIWAIDADPKLRYARVMEKKKENERITFEQFIAEEKQELTNMGTSAEDLVLEMQKADVMIENNGTKEELLVRVNTELQKLL